MSNELSQGNQQKREHLNFLIYTAGILKRTFKESLDDVAKIYRSETGNNLKTYGPMEWPNHGNDEYEDIWKTTNIDYFPDVVAAMGFGDFFRKEFVKKFVKKGCFKSVWDMPMGSAFEKAGFRDPCGWYTPYAVVPFVMLVDRTKLGDLPAPKQWKDLLEPEYRNNVIISSTGDGAANVPLLYLYKEFGEKGIAQLAANIGAIWSAPRIAREAGSVNAAGAAVYILSWFFAQSCPRTETVSVVWPEDGAVTSPFYLLVKESKTEEMRALVQYVTGSELGKKSARLCLPVLNADVDNALPQGASFKWLGWDYIQSHDTAELREYSHALFMSKWKNVKHNNREPILWKEDDGETEHINFLGYAPGLFRHVFRDGLNSTLRTYRIKTGNSLKSYYPMSCYEDRYANIWKTQHIDDFPDAVASMGLGNLFRKEFVEHFVNKGHFKNVWEGSVNKHFEDAGLIDPDGWYTIYSVMPFLIFVDLKKLGPLPLPKKWGDLLNPQFRDKVILPGTEDTVSIVPIYIFKEYGNKGLEQLSVNMKMALQSTEMARLVGSSSSPAPVYVMSWFFARSCPRPESTAIIWPEDGAIVNPLYMLVKKEKINEVAPAINYVLGPELGRQISHTCFPVINSRVNNNLLEGASFKWIGWDYIKSHNIVELREQAQEFFIATWRKSHGKGK